MRGNKDLRYDRLIGWPAGCLKPHGTLAGRPDVWPAGQQAGQLAGWLADRLSGWQVADRLASLSCLAGPGGPGVMSCLQI